MINAKSSVKIIIFHFLWFCLFLPSGRGWRDWASRISWRECKAPGFIISCHPRSMKLQQAATWSSLSHLKKLTQASSRGSSAPLTIIHEYYDHKTILSLFELFVPHRVQEVCWDLVVLQDPLDHLYVLWLLPCPHVVSLPAINMIGHESCLMCPLQGVAGVDGPQGPKGNMVQTQLPL